MNIQKRIQEALTRRHKNEDGFTLIELLVVILIIAILAAVAIFALLSSLGSAKKSNAKSTLRASQSTFQSTQAGLGITNFGANGAYWVTQAGVPTAQGNGKLDKAEKDVYFTTVVLPANNARIDKVIYFNWVSTSQVVMASRDEDNNCFYIELNAATPTRYSSNNAGTAACGSVLPAANISAEQKKGWAI